LGEPALTTLVISWRIRRRFAVLEGELRAEFVARVPFNFLGALKSDCGERL
jgi:hypothetical protein